MFRVIIAGGRDFNNYPGLAKAMDFLLSNVTDDITIVCGKARGADALGEQYAKERGTFLRTGTSTVVLRVLSATSKWLKTLMLWWPFGTERVVAHST